VDRQYLVECGAEPLTHKPYLPLTKTGLFRTFAETEIPDGILRFANAFGFLGSPYTIRVQRPSIDAPGSIGMGSIGSGESPHDWIGEISAVRETVKLFDALRGTASGQKWNELQEIINGKIKQHRSYPRLLWERAGNQRRLRLRFQPASLIGAIWIQFALGVEGNRDYRQCEQCRTWFEVAAEKREGAKFCSDACRFKAYRNRQKDARRLHAAGISIGNIATKCGSDVKTVRGWITKGTEV
jgi:hypothetical protein